MLILKNEKKLKTIGEDNVTLAPLTYKRAK